MKRVLLIIGIGFLFAHTPQVSADDMTTAKLDTCISYYQDGDYQKTVDSIKALLPLISDRREEAEAYKYLGFSFVMLDMINKAKEFFKVALEKFPKMVIDTLEVPPNITIVFKQTKLESQLEKGEYLDKNVQEGNQKRVVFATILTSVGAIGAGTGGYFFYSAYKSNQSYNAITTPYDGYQEDLDRFWNKKQKELIIGGCATGVAAVTVYFGLRLFFKKPAPVKNVGMIINPDRLAIAWYF